MSSVTFGCAVGTSLAVLWISGSSLAQTGGKTAQSAPASPVVAPAAPPAAAPTPDAIGQQATRSAVRATEPAGTGPAQVPAAPGARPPMYATPNGYWYYGPPPPVVESRSRWYGWQTLAADGAALSLLVLGASVRGADSPFLWVATGTYLLLPPAIHVAHGNVGKGVGSLVLRVGAPVLGGFVGAGLEDCSRGSDFCGLSGAAVGALVGYASAVAIDAAVLARENGPAEPPDRTVGSRMSLLPLIARDLHGVALGGAF